MKEDSIRLFLSYSHKDEVLKERLVHHLRVLQQYGMILSSHECKILPGDEWDFDHIRDQLKTADIILLLISSDFIASRYCWWSAKTALPRHEAGEACVIPIILQTVDRIGTPFSQLQALPTNGMPVSGWANLDDACLDVAQGIAKVAKTLSVRPRPKSMTRLFLCYASEDKTPVTEIYQRLQGLGFQPWMDHIDLLPGQVWEIEIPKALKTSDFILIFLSRTSVAKRGYVQREFKLALDTLQEIPEGVIHTIPVQLEDCEVPAQFGRLHWGNLLHKDGFERVVQAIQAGLWQRQ